jgi:hypothetical protein
MSLLATLEQQGGHDSLVLCRLAGLWSCIGGAGACCTSVFVVSKCSGICAGLSLVVCGVYCVAAVDT